MYKKIIIIGIVFIAVGGFIFFSFTSQEQTFNKRAELETLSQCLRDEGAIFYGAFWCPNCAEQKAIFGKSAKTLPYIECSTEDGNDQTQICKEENITAYPTWQFSNGARCQGVMSDLLLSTFSSCEGLTRTDEEVSKEYLFNSLVKKRLTSHISRRGETTKQIKEEIERYTTLIEEIAEEKHEKTTEELTSQEYIVILGEILNNCQIYNKNTS